MASSAWPATDAIDSGQEPRDLCNYENYALPGAILTSFHELRQSKELIDVVLITGDVEIPCHRVVLAATSPYFKAMFTSNVEEALQDRITLKDVNSDMLQLIIDYMYTSQVRITTENVQELLVTANFFLLKCLVYACSNFLVRQLDVDNCVAMHGFAESQGCQELAAAARAFTARRFPEVCKTEGFLSAGAPLLRQYAADESLSVRSEAELLRALLEWLTHGRDRQDRQRCFLSLVRHVRLPFVGRECLEELGKLPAAMGLDPAGCQELFALASACQEDRVTSVPSEWRCPRRSTNYIEMLLLIGGVQRRNEGTASQNKSNLCTYCCDPQSEAHCWSKLAPFPYALRNVVMYDTVRCRNDVFVTGGFDGEKQPGAIASVWAYRTEADSWERLPSLNGPRYQHCSAVLGGQIYVIGGFDGQTKLASVEVYDAKSNAWLCIQPMATPVAFAAATAFNERLYVIGGIKEDDQVFGGMQCYDPVSKAWTLLTTLQPKSKGCKSVLLNDLIYVLGGVSKEVQVYDPVCDKAFSVAPMTDIHMCTAATILNGRIYVAGGDNLEADTDRHRWDSLECYDPSLDQWSLVGKLPLPLYLHGLVTVIRNRLTLHTPPNEMLQPIGPSMLYRGYGEGGVDYDPR